MKPMKNSVVSFEFILMLVALMVIIVLPASAAPKAKSGKAKKAGAKTAGKPAPAPPIRGTLRVHPKNPRYFTDDSGRAILLTGSHTWDNLVDMGPEDPPAPFDFNEYIDWMAAYPHNFMRMWTWELVSWDTAANREKVRRVHFAAPHPWVRSGPGQALDGKPKFDLGKLDAEYFERLRQRVQAAGERGIYVSVMLFEGWGVQFIKDGFKSHPFHADNNVSGINGDKNGDGAGMEIHELLDPKITAIQEAYVRKVIDTVNDLDNVLYEISNENHTTSTQWQYHMIRFIKDYEKTKPKQHPVGMTFQYKGGKNQTLFDSPADWISPNPDGGYRDNPPTAKGDKVIISDTDHLWGIGGSSMWVWKSVMRGLNPIFMDPYKEKVLNREPTASYEPIRKSMGYALGLARRVDLAGLIPNGELASSKYCLAKPGSAYLVYSPDGKAVTLDLAGTTRSFEVEWLNPASGEMVNGKTIQGGTRVTLTPPFNAREAVVYLK